MNWNEVIFLAHASEDKVFVRRFYQILRENGLKPWLDEVNLEPGVRWEEQIKEAIKNAGFFIAFISKTSVNKSGYIQKELRMALNELEQKPPGKIYFIPALIDDVELPNISVGTINLRDYQAARISDDVGCQKLIDYLKKNLGIIKNLEKRRLEDFNSIRDLLVNGYVGKALNMFYEYLFENNRDFANNALLLLGRYGGLQLEYEKGKITRDEFNLETNRMVVSLLETMSLVEEASNEA